MTTIIPGFPDWAFFVCLIILVLGIYLFLISTFPEVKSTLNNVIKKIGLWVVLLGVWLYWRAHSVLVSEMPNDFPATLNRADFFVGLGVIFFLWGASWLYKERYFTSHFICDNVSGSCHRFHEVGNMGDPANNWVVFLLGGSGRSDEKMVFPWPFIQRVVVVPKSACEWRGNQIVAHSHVSKTDLYDLSPEVRNFLENDTFGKWAKENIYCGLWDIKKIAKDPKYSEIEDLMKKLNSRVNELDDMLKGRLTRMKTFLSDTIAMKNKSEGKDWRMNNGPPMGSGSE